jgi:hypothetical protein
MQFLDNGGERRLIGFVPTSLARWAGQPITPHLRKLRLQAATRNAAKLRHFE